MLNMTENEQKICAFLERERRSISPTKIGKACSTGRPSNYSSWACKNCRRLIEKGYIVKNYIGHYKSAFPQLGEFTGDKIHAQQVISEFLYKMKGVK